MLSLSTLFRVSLSTFVVFNTINTASGDDVVHEHDQSPDCSGWAQAGQCTERPQYMWSNCVESCRQHDPESEGRSVGGYMIRNLRVGVSQGIWSGI